MIETKTSTFDANSKLRALEVYWRERCHGRRFARRSDIDPLSMRAWLGNLHLVEAVDGGHDFVMRLFGSNVAQSFGRDLTGQSAQEFPRHHTEFIVGAYREVLADGQPLYTAHVMSIEDRKYAAWERIVLPLSSDGDRVDLLLVGLYRVRIEDYPAYEASLADAGIAPFITQEPDGAF